MRAFLSLSASLVAAALLPAALRAATINGTVVGPDSTTAVANATVILSQAGTAGGARTPVDTLQTDAEGKFSFASLAAAQNYGINVTATGLTPYTNNNVDLGTDSAVATLSIRLATPPPPSDISGTVRNGVDTASAIAGATVVLSQPGTAGGARTPVDTATTDAAGKFAFPDLAAMDNYGLSITAAGFSTYTNNNIDLEGTDTALTINLLPNADIAGTVLAGTDAASPPAAGATVVLTRAGTGGGGGGTRTPVDTATTDAEGKFAFPDLASMDNYGLTVTATGFSTYTNNNIDLRGRDTSVTINLLGPADIGGTVVGPDSTTVVANATVVLTRAGTGGGGGGGRTPVDTATTDAQGKFAFPDIASMENYGLTVTATGFATYTNNNIDLRGRDTAVTVVLALPPPPGTITGVVRGPGGATASPVANATVVLSQPGTGGGARTPIDTTQTDAQGSFTFTNVPAGDNYGLSVTADGFNVATNNNVDLDGGDTATANFTLVVVSILPRALQARGFAADWSGAGLTLTLPPASAPRTLSVFVLSGALRHRTDIPAGIAKVHLPSQVLHGHGLFLEVSGAGRRDVLPLPGR